MQQLVDYSEPLLEHSQPLPPRRSIWKKHQLGLWAALRWIVLIVAVIFVVGYVGLVMLLPPIAKVNVAYPKFWGNIGFYIHAIPGSIWLILGAIQQFSYIRSKYPFAHKVIGYLALPNLYASIVGGFFICISGQTEGGITLVVDGIFMFVGWGVCGFMGWYYIKFQYNIEKHREWMFRAYLLSYVIVLMRPAIVLVAMITPINAGEGLALIAPLFFLIAIIIIETHIRRQRENQNNIETNFVSLPKTPTNQSEEDGEHQIVSYRDGFVSVRLISKHNLTDNVCLFVLKMPSSANLLMFPGHHVILRTRTRNGMVCRPYTPVTSLVRYFGATSTAGELIKSMNMPGTVAIAVKRYQNGAMSAWLHDSLRIGDSIELMGPSGGFYYYPNDCEHVGMIAGGTGITPILSVLLSMLGNRSDRTRISLIYCNSTENDVIFRHEITALSEQFPDRFTVQFLVGKRISRQIIQEQMPPAGDATRMLVCGPVSFNTIVQKILGKERHGEHMMFTFGESDK